MSRRSGGQLLAETLPPGQISDQLQRWLDGDASRSAGRPLEVLYKRRRTAAFGFGLIGKDACADCEVLLRGIWRSGSTPPERRAPTAER